jgi:uncharacterized membrane protein
MATTPASVDKHPLHPMLVAFPIGLWMFSLVCDLLFRFGSGEVVWHLMAWYTLVAGVIGAVVAAIPGLIDFFSIRDPRAGKVGMIHLVLNVALVTLYSVNAWIRTILEPDAVLPVLLSVVGVAGLVVTGWLGGELVYIHKVSVAQAEAHPASRRSSKRAA